MAIYSDFPFKLVIFHSYVKLSVGSFSLSTFLFMAGVKGDRLLWPHVDRLNLRHLAADGGFQGPQGMGI